MAPWLLLTLALAQYPAAPDAPLPPERRQSPAAPDAPLTPEQRQGMAQSADGTLDGGVGTTTGAPDPNALPGTGGSGTSGTMAPLPGTADAGTPYTVPPPFPGTQDGGTGTAPTFAPGTGGTAPGSTGTQPTPGGQAAGTGAAAAQQRPGDAAAQGPQADPAGTVVMNEMEIEGPPAAETPEQAAAALRAQVQALQSRGDELQAEQERLRAQNEDLQAQLDEAQDRAADLEAAREERLATLEDTTGSLADMDALLSVGNTDVQGQLEGALGSLEQVIESAESSGQGNEAVWAVRAREALDGVGYAVDNRSYYEARLAMQQAAAYMRAARLQAMERKEGALLRP